MAVGKTVGTGGSVDTLNPETAEGPLTVLTVTIGVGHGLTDGVLRITEQFGAEAAETLGFREGALTALAAGWCVSGSWHFLISKIKLLFESRRWPLLI